MAIIFVKILKYNVHVIPVHIFGVPILQYTVRWSELSLNNTAHSQTVAMQWRKIPGNGSTHSDAVSSANTL